MVSVGGYVEMTDGNDPFSVPAAPHRVNDGGASMRKRMLYQFLDIEIFQIINLSIKADIRGTSSPQRALRALECVFEAAPQVMSGIFLVNLISC